MGIPVAEWQLLIAKIKKEYKMTHKNKKGFTIIEVVLVLAIAGLIFLMVFIALPALQRSQRNTPRGDDLSRFLTAVNSYQSNNQGKTPWKNGTSTDTYFVKRYIDQSCGVSTHENYDTACGSEFTDPDGNSYRIAYKGKLTANNNAVYTATTTFESNAHQIFVYTNAKCGDENQALKGTGDRQVAMFYLMEGGSIACYDNQ